MVIRVVYMLMVLLLHTGALATKNNGPPVQYIFVSVQYIRPPSTVHANRKEYHLSHKARQPHTKQSHTPNSKHTSNPKHTLNSKHTPRTKHTPNSKHTHNSKHAHRTKH
ncbi:hypothetical protein NEFER01_2131, partial [Nematocida sp. LUAm1]